MKSFSSRLAEIEACVNNLSAGMPAGQIAELRHGLEHLLSWAKQQLGKMDKHMIGIIAETGQDICWPIDDKGNQRRFYIGNSRSVRCRDTSAALNVLLQLSVEDAIECLCSNPFKAGGIQKGSCGQRSA